MNHTNTTQNKQWIVVEDEQNQPFLATVLEPTCCVGTTKTVLRFDEEQAMLDHLLDRGAQQTLEQYQESINGPTPEEPEPAPE